MPLFLPECDHADATFVEVRVTDILDQAADLDGKVDIHFRHNSLTFNYTIAHLDMKCNKIRHLYLLFYIYCMIHTLIIIAIAIAIFAFGMGLGAWLENVRLTSIHAEDNLMQRITHEFEVQKETIWAAAELHQKENPSSGEEGYWDDVKITQRLPEVTGEYQRD